MASKEEIRVVQNSLYFDILDVEQMNQKAGIPVKGLKKLKNKLRSSMHDEDVARVEKIYAESNEGNE